MLLTPSNRYVIFCMIACVADKKGVDGLNLILDKTMCMKDLFLLVSIRCEWLSVLVLVKVVDLYMVGQDIPHLANMSVTSLK